MKQNMNPFELDTLDKNLAAGSGALCAMLDSFFFSELSLEKAFDLGRLDGQKLTNWVCQTPVIRDMAKEKLNRNLSKETSFGGQIQILEQLFESPHDQLTSTFGGGLQHHHCDFCHHASPLGLFFSVLSQFTGHGYGRDVSGHLISPKIEGYTPADSIQAVFRGTLFWMMHLVSDLNGSSSTAYKGKAGTGIPGPLMSAVSVLSSLPGIRNLKICLQANDPQSKVEMYKLASKMFNGTLFGKNNEARLDLRAEIGIIHGQLNNQRYLPILFNKIAVSALFMIRRLSDLCSRQNITSFKQLTYADLSSLNPISNRAFMRIHQWASVSYFMSGTSSALLMAYISHPKDRAAFIAAFITRVPYLSLMDMSMVLQLGTVQKASDWFNSQYRKMYSNPAIVSGWMESSQQWSGSVLKGTSILRKLAAHEFPVYELGQFAIQEYQQAARAHYIAIENRIHVEDEAFRMIEILQANRQAFQELTNSYFNDFYSNTLPAVDEYEKAAEANPETFMKAAVSLQNKLGQKQSFQSMDEFNAMMLDDQDFVF